MSSHIFDKLRTLKVLVVPVGENSLFDAHFDLISSTKYVTKDEIQPGVSSSSSKISETFKDFKWSEGNAVFEYLRYDVAESSSAGSNGSNNPLSRGDNDYIEVSHCQQLVMNLHVCITVNS